MDPAHIADLIVALGSVKGGGLVWEKLRGRPGKGSLGRIEKRLDEYTAKTNKLATDLARLEGRLGVD